MHEKAATDEKRRERDRDKLGGKLVAYVKRKEEEDEATCLMEEMRKNVEAAQHKSFEAEQSMQRFARTRRKIRQSQGRAGTLMTKCWQSMQSRNTNNFNLEKDLEDIQSTARKSGLVRRRENGKVVEAAGG